MAGVNVPHAPASAPDVIIDVLDRLAELSARRQPGGGARAPEKFTIFRVPVAVRRDKDDAFDPSVISIGPFHRGKKEFRAMEEHKVRYLYDFLSRRSTLTLDLLLEEIRPLETRARRCYSETVDLGSDEFVMMLVLDGCFLLEFFLRIDEGRAEAAKKEGGWSWAFINCDILMLENQIPFFVIETLYKIFISQPEDDDVATDGHIAGDDEAPGKEDAAGGASDVNVDQVSGGDDDGGNSDDDTRMPEEFLALIIRSVIDHELRDPLPERPAEIMHLLHLCHHYFVPCPQNPNAVEPLKNMEEDGGDDQQLDFEPAMVMPRATELEDAGIKIKKKEEPQHVLDVTFDTRKGILEIPPLFLTDRIKPLFLNLLAFEQCVGGPVRNLTAFGLFLDCMVNTTEDVVILEGSEVVGNFLSGEEEAAAFFNSLGQGMELENAEHYLAQAFRDINGYCRRPWNKNRAVLMRDYFGSPWALISFLAAFLLLALSIIQTVFVLYSYYVPPK